MTLESPTGRLRPQKLPPTHNFPYPWRVGDAGTHFEAQLEESQVRIRELARILNVDPDFAWRAAKSFAERFPGRYLDGVDCFRRKMLDRSFGIRYSGRAFDAVDFTAIERRLLRLHSARFHPKRPRLGLKSWTGLNTYPFGLEL